MTNSRTVASLSGPAFALDAFRFRCPCGQVTEIRLQPQRPEQLPLRCPRCKSKDFATLRPILESLRGLWQQATFAGIRIEGMLPDDLMPWEDLK